MDKCVVVTSKQPRRLTIIITGLLRVRQNDSHQAQLPIRLIQPVNQSIQFLVLVHLGCGGF